MFSESVPKTKRQVLLKCCYIHKANFCKDVKFKKKKIVAMIHTPGAFINSYIAEIHDSVCQMISLLETLTVLWKFSDLFHKSLHLSPCVILSVFKAVSTLSSSPMPALLRGLAPSCTEPCCLQTAKHFSETACGFMLQGEVLYFISSSEPFTGTLWQ